MEIILGIACILLLLLCLTLGSVCGKLSAQKEQIEAMEKIVENYKAELKRTYEKNEDLFAENLALQRRQNAASEAWSAITAAITQQKETKKPETAAPEAKPEPENSGEVMPIPDAPTNVLSCEPYMTKEKDESGNIRYKNAFAANSEQAMLQEDCFTDDYGPFQGVRYYLHDGTAAYCAALSTNYAGEIGTVLEVTLRNGVSFNVICADFKNPLGDLRKDWYGTPCRNYSEQDAVCVIEFVVDMERIPNGVRTAGTFTAMPELGGLYGEGGNIKEIRKVGRWWKP